MSNMSKSRPRANVATNVKRALWAESMGYCMRPKCDTRLLDEGTNVAEQAHIVPHADGGVDSAENLILLCRSCHKKIDDNRDATPTQGPSTTPHPTFTRRLDAQPPPTPRLRAGSMLNHPPPHVYAQARCFHSAQAEALEEMPERVHPP